MCGPKKLQGGHHRRVSQSWEVSEPYMHAWLGAPRQAQDPLYISVSPHFTVGTKRQSLAPPAPGSLFFTQESQQPLGPTCVLTASTHSVCYANELHKQGPLPGFSGKHCAGLGLNNHELQSRCAVLREADAAPGSHPTPRHVGHLSAPSFGSC